MFKIPTVLTAEELIDKAFKRASKVQVEDSVRIFRLRKTYASRVKTASAVIDATLSKYILGFPSLDQIPRFYYELIDVLVGIDRLKKSLGAIDWARKKVVEIADKIARKILHSRDLDYINSERKGAYGRISSIINQVSEDLKFLNNAKNVLMKMPTVDPSLPTIVIAGYPNVGKSLLIKKVSTAEPKIAQYPFTTKGVLIGHFNVARKRYQVIDTPGLLDRDFSKRNKIERQAILALKHLADVIVFILDPSGHCGYEIERQERLLETIKENFSEIPLIVVENKCDLFKSDTQRLKISAETGENLDLLTQEMLRNVNSQLESLIPEQCSNTTNLS